MPKVFYLHMVFKKQILQAANIDLFNKLLPKACNSDLSVKVYNFLYKLSQQKSVKASFLAFFIFSPSALMG